MRITDIQFDNISPEEENIVAELSLTFDDAICVHKVHIINGKKGLFVAFPNTGEMRRYRGSKRFFDIVHPLSKSLRQEINNEVLLAYENYTKNND